MKKISFLIVALLLIALKVSYSSPIVISSSGGSSSNETQIDRIVGEHAADDNASEKATRTDVFVTPDGLTHFRAYVKMLTASSNFTSGYVAYADGNLVLTGDSNFTWDGNLLTVNGGLFLGGKTYLIAHIDNILSIRNGSNAGGYRWYYNYVSVSDYDYGYLSIDDDNVTIGQDSNETSQDNKNLVLKPGGSGVIKNPGGSFQVTGAGAVIAKTVTADSYSSNRVSGSPTEEEFYEDLDYGDNKSRVTLPAGNALTAPRHFYLPDQNGTAEIRCTSSHDYAAGSDNWTLTTPESLCSHISVTNASGGGVIAKITTPLPGHNYTVENGSGQELTFKISGQTGGTIANGKSALYITTSTDVLEAYEQP